MYRYFILSLLLMFKVGPIIVFSILFRTLLYLSLAIGIISDKVLRNPILKA